MPKGGFKIIKVALSIFTLGSAWKLEAIVVGYGALYFFMTVMKVSGKSGMFFTTTIGADGRPRVSAIDFMLSIS